MNGEGRYLLDTNLVIAIFADEPEVRTRLTTASEIFVPSIVVGELHFGAHKSSYVEANLARIDRFTATVPVLNCDLNTAPIYGRIKHQLRVAGRPIPENDLWTRPLPSNTNWCLFREMVISARSPTWSSRAGKPKDRDLR